MHPDVTSEIGLGLKHMDGRSGRFYFLEELRSGTAFFDNDNDLDIYFVNGSDLPGHNSAKKPINQLYQNDGRGNLLMLPYKLRGRLGLWNWLLY